MGQTYTGLSGKTKDDFGHGQARFVTYMNVFSNPVSNPEMTEPIEIDPKQNEVEVGDVFFTTSSETPEEVGMSSILLEKRGKTYLNSFCFGFRPSEKIDSYYLAYMLRSESARAKITLLAQGISRYNISKNKVMEIAVSLPSLDEQKMIGQYFSQLDNLITLHQCKCDYLIRLKCWDFSSLNKTAWEQRKLGDTNTFFTDGNYGEVYPKASDMTDSSTGIPFLTGGNLKNGRLDLSGANYITYEKHMKLTSGHLAEDDIVIAVRGSLGALGYVNKENSGWNINSQLAILRTDKTVLIGKYLIQFLLSTTGQKELLSKQTGSALKQLPISSLKDIAIPITSIEEQERIGMYLQNLDNLITLHQRELEKLQNIKKSMLEKMFV